jgi:hypothetical protein
MGYRRPGSAKSPFGILFLVVVVSFVMGCPLRLLSSPMIRAFCHQPSSGCSGQGRDGCSDAATAS